MPLSEIIVHYAFRLYSKTVEISRHGLDEHWWSAQVIFAVFWSVMVFKVCVAHAVDGEACIVFHTCCIGLRVRTVEREVHVEVGEFLLQFPEVFKEERL